MNSNYHFSLKRCLFPVVSSAGLLCLILIFVRPQMHAQGADRVTIEYRDVYDQFKNLKINPEQKAAVENFTFHRDVGNFTLEKGTLYFCKPVNNRVYAAVFHGKGFFSFTPPTEVEQAQLARFYKKKSFTQRFKTLFIVFADSTQFEFEKRLTFQPGGATRQARDDVDYALKYLQRKKGKQFDTAIMKIALDDLRNGFFYAHFSRDKTKPFFFEINPFEDEEVRFMRRFSGPSFYYIPEIINQFHRQPPDAAAQTHQGEKASLRVNTYLLDIHLQGRDLKFSATATVNFTAVQAAQNWIFFRLFHQLEVDSAFWDNGKPAEYIKEKHNPFLWIKGDHPLQKGEKRLLTIHYHGRLIEREKDWFYIRSSRNWYPKHGNRHRALFDVTYHYPRDYQFASAGRAVSADTLNGVITSRWIAENPMHSISFNIGFFKEYKIANDTIPPVTVQVAETGHREIARALGRQGIGSGSHMEKQVGKDIANSMKFFQKIYAPLPYSRFFATDIPFSHGEAFPGLIHLSWRTFQMTLDNGDDEIFRAHEVAHQWWGIGVDFATYHDQWLSEAFSEYSGWWYFHEVVKREEKNDKKFYEVLKSRRKEITGNRKFLFGSGKKAGPIWLGYRTLSSETQGDYRLIIYQKGAWVLHMLRVMMQDLQNGDESEFQTLMHGFYQLYHGKKASTQNFRAFAEVIYGKPLDWFFKQWVYGTDIPKYKFSYIFSPDSSGAYIAKCRVLQENVSDNFRMPILLGIDFGNDHIQPVRQWVEGDASEFELGPFPKKPKKIIFNYRESVLCQMDYEKWHDSTN